MRSAFRKAIALAAVLAVAACATAYALTAEFGPIVVSATATVQPRELPKSGGAPITLRSVTRVKTKDGSTPPALQSIEFLIDKHGRVNGKAFPVCSPAKLEGATPSQARQRCAKALVGKGLGKALVTMPGKAPFRLTFPLSFFNAPPTGGKPTLIAHAYETIPAPKALLVPIVIERVSSGRYGFRTKVEMPEIAGGYGIPILAEANVGTTRKRGGGETGYIEARCAGGRLQVEGNLNFANGDSFPATLTSPCHFPR
ncbi:MAG: hypothetical protein M3Y75_13870 [Actinomycetota bacterium]|nr:hypothetical protein [Actinomycetota bacterium]